MPLEIKELNVKISVAPPSGGPGTPSASAGPGSAASGGADKDAIIAACVEQVLEILKEKRER